MKNKIVLCYCIVSLSSYAAEVVESASDYSCDANSLASSISSDMSSRTQPISVPMLPLETIQRTRSNSMPSPLPQFIILSPKKQSPRKKQIQKKSYGVEPSLLFALVDNAYERNFWKKTKRLFCPTGSAEYFYRSRRK